MSERLYSVAATSTGNGRNGRVATSDGAFESAMATPVVMGGSGAGLNPEQLFAAGYSACFHSALQTVSRRDRVRVDGSTVTASVELLHQDDDRYTIRIELEVDIPGLVAEDVERLALAAHAICPYSRATRGDAEVSVIAAGQRIATHSGT